MMTTQGEIFGTTPKGETVYRVKISGGGLTAHVITWGAVIQDLRLEGHDAPLVLGFDNFDDYPKYSSYFGATRGVSPIESARVSSRWMAGIISWI